ncbi:MAG: BTAD domain-containing putative transcriptional regulator [Mycobacterium leprae]
MELRILGPVAVVTEDGRSLTLGGAQQRAVVVLLALEPGHAVSRTALMDGIWGDDPPDMAANTLQVYVSQLRKSLGRGMIRTVGSGYALGAALRVDQDRFSDLVGEGSRQLERGELKTAGETLQEALGLWRGPALADVAEFPFAQTEVARLEELRLAAIEQRIEADLACGRHRELVAELRALIAAHPFRERSYAQLMVALYRAGRQVDALRVYRDYRNRLDGELGLEPSAALQRLESDVLRQDPVLDGPPPMPAAAVAGPPPTTPGSPPGNLPRTLSDLVGRDDTLERVLDTLAMARVVTLIGPGGVGKSSLALHAAGRAQGHPDGGWLCELAAVAEPAAVADAVATVLSVQQRQGLTVVERLVEYLRPKRLLLVLDNCEHVLDDAAHLVDAIARGCPSVTVLATSREPLGVSGEHVRPIPPLAVPPTGPIDAVRARQIPAVALFVARARAAAPEFVLSEGNVAAVAEICRRLDGLPLAIELAAPRLRSMTPADVVEHLGSRFHFLRSGQRIAAERHRTLRAVVDWSYQLLSETERRTFDRLSVFAGAFGVQAAARVVAGANGSTAAPGDELEVADLLAGLVDKSMLVALTDDVTSRYLLLDTLRAYGRERLAARGEADAVQRAHAAYHVGFVELADRGLAGPDHVRWANAITRALDDLRAAHAWALGSDVDLAVRLVAGLFRFVEHRMVSEITIWAERTVDVAEGVSRSSLLPAAYGVAASGARFRGDLTRARTLAERGVAVSAGPDHSARALPLFVLGEVALFEGRLADAERFYLETERVAAQAGEAGFAAYARAGRLVAAAYSHDPTSVAALADETCAAVDAVGDPVASAWVRYAAGEARLDSDPDRAAVLLDEAIARGRALGERYLTGVALVSAASLRGRHGNPHRALPLFRDVIEHWHQAGIWTQQWTTIRNVVELLVRMRADEAAAVLHGAVTSRPIAPPVFGADAHRLDEAQRVLTDRLGADAFVGAAAQGAAMRDDDVVAFAYSTIESVRTAVQPG